MNIKGLPQVTLTGAQIKELLDYAVPDDIPQQFETEITIAYFPGGENDPETGLAIPAGNYAWFSEYPEEGSILL